MTQVFFRDDDVGELTPALRCVVELLASAGVPCNYEVVPANLSPAAAKYLGEARAAHPGLISLNQHGNVHEQTLNGEHVWSEFAGGRPYEEQRAAIREGRDRLRDALGGDFCARVFTPPCHKYDETTLRALADLGFDVLSAGFQPDRLAQWYYAAGRRLGRVSWLGRRVSYHAARLPRLPMVEVSCAIDVDEDQDASGRRIEKSEADLAAELARARRVHPIVGVMLHHATYEDRRQAGRARGVRARLRADPEVRFATISRSPTRPQADASASARRSGRRRVAQAANTAFATAGAIRARPPRRHRPVARRSR
jgi:hypothetical protein